MRCQYFRSDAPYVYNYFDLNTNVEAFYSNVEAFCSNVEAFYSNVEAFCSNVEAFFSNVEAFFSNVEAFCSNVEAFCSNVEAFCSNIEAFNLNLKLVYPPPHLPISPVPNPYSLLFAIIVANANISTFSNISNEFPMLINLETNIIS